MHACRPRCCHATCIPASQHVTGSPATFMSYYVACNITLPLALTHRPPAPDPLCPACPRAPASCAQLFTLDDWSKYRCSNRFWKHISTLPRWVGHCTCVWLRHLCPCHVCCTCTRTGTSTPSLHQGKQATSPSNEAAWNCRAGAQGRREGALD